LPLCDSDEFGSRRKDGKKGKEEEEEEDFLQGAMWRVCIFSISSPCKSPPAHPASLVVSECSQTFFSALRRFFGDALSHCIALVGAGEIVSKATNGPPSE